MDKNDGFIQAIYDSMIEIVMNGMDKNDRELIEKKYREILNNRYSELDINASNYDKLYNLFLRRETREWTDFSLNERKNIFIGDPALEEIISLSNQAFEYAWERLTNSSVIPVKVCNDSIKRMNELSSQVKDFNKKLSLWYLSEGGVDFTYASGMSENTSLRLGRARELPGITKK
jgi:hypothetical protein